MTTTHPYPTTVPVPTGLAAAILGVNRDQLGKLIGVGLIRQPTTTPGGQRRLNPNDVLALAARPFVSGAAPGDLAVHLAPLHDDPDPLANRRLYVGWHASRKVTAAQHPSRKVTAAQAEDAWAGLWNCNPDLYDGALVGNVSGFVVEVAAIEGYQRINGHIRFTLAPPTKAMLRRYAGRRIHARAGGVVQPLR